MDNNNGIVIFSEALFIQIVNRGAYCIGKSGITYGSAVVYNGGFRWVLTRPRMDSIKAHQKSPRMAVKLVKPSLGLM